MTFCLLSFCKLSFLYHSLFAPAVQTSQGHLHLYSVHTWKDTLLPSSTTSARDIQRVDVYLRSSIHLGDEVQATCLAGDARHLLLGCRDGALATLTWLGKASQQPPFLPRTPPWFHLLPQPPASTQSLSGFFNFATPPFQPPLLPDGIWLLRTSPISRQHPVRLRLHCKFHAVLHTHEYVMCCAARSSCTTFKGLVSLFGPTQMLPRTLPPWMSLTCQFLFGRFQCRHNLIYSCPCQLPGATNNLPPGQQSSRGF